MYANSGISVKYYKILYRIFSSGPLTIETSKQPIKKIDTKGDKSKIVMTTRVVISVRGEFRHDDNASSLAVNGVIKRKK